MGWLKRKENLDFNDTTHRLRNNEAPEDKTLKKRKVWGIKKAMLEFIIESSKDSYPNEFYAKLLQKNNIEQN